MRSKVELYEQIRRDRAIDPAVSIRELARRHRVHRREVRSALGSAVPEPRKRPERASPKLGRYHAIIDEWLIADRDAPRKQRHTAKRIWERLVAEHDADVAEVTVRTYVRARRRELAPAKQAFVPQQHAPGDEAEVDWGEAEVIVAGARMKVHLFVMRSCHSGASFVQAFAHETQQAFLEGHVDAFGFFGGVFNRIRYDNLGSAVKQVLRGRRRVETDRFVALRSHYLYQSEFTLAGVQGAHEKGGVESEVGRFRRRHLVPVPQVESIAELNAMLRAACDADLERRITGRERTVGEMLAYERSKLRELPEFAFITDEVIDVRVNAKSLVTVRQNTYSVPVRLVGRTVQARIGARRIQVFAERRLVAEHGRLSGRFGTSAQLDHYLELLRSKPGALAGSVALHAERDRGRWPAVYDELWAGIAERYGPSDAASQMVDVLLLAREYPPDRVVEAVAGAVAAGCYDGRAVAVLARRASQARPAPIVDLAPHLSVVAAREPALQHYNQLLTRNHE
jgi:transposase